MIKSYAEDYFSPGRKVKPLFLFVNSLKSAVGKSISQPLIYLLSVLRKGRTVISTPKVQIKKQICFTVHKIQSSFIYSTLNKINSKSQNDSETRQCL